MRKTLILFVTAVGCVFLLSMKQQSETLTNPSVNGVEIKAKKEIRLYEDGLTKEDLLIKNHPEKFYRDANGNFRKKRTRKGTL